MTFPPVKRFRGDVLRKGCVLLPMLLAVPLQAQRTATPTPLPPPKGKIVEAENPAEAVKPVAGAVDSDAVPKAGDGATKTPEGAGGGGRRRGGGAGGDAAKPEKPEKNAYDFYLPGADGKDVPLSRYKDKYIVVVNLGRKSSLSEQLPALVKLNDSYKGKNLVVIGVPSDEFGAAEPGTDAEVQKVYADAKVDFLVTALTKTTGDDENPFYKYLTSGKNAPAGGSVAWNYTKFIVDKQGNVVARLDPDVAPDSAEMLATVDEILAGTYKPKRAGGAGGGGKGPGGAAGPE